MSQANASLPPEKVVARYADGRVLKGHTSDFSTERPTFTLTPLDGAGTESPIEVRLQDLKAVFFVKDFEGDADYTEWKQFVEPRLGLKVALKFADGEVMVGAKLPLAIANGFFLFPADHASNNEKVFVVSAAVTVVEQVPE
jgi:hypothetical protein